MVQTRSASSSPVKKTPARLEPSVEQKEPLRLFILPQDISSAARFLLLSHAGDQSKKRYLFCPSKGLFEFTKISAPSIDPRSILFTSKNDTAQDVEEARPEDICQRITHEDAVSDGYIQKCADLLVATAYDMIFFLMPLLASSKKALFRPLDDIFEDHIRSDQHFRYIYIHGKNWVEEAMLRICETMTAGDELTYRLSADKVVRLVLDKARQAAKRGLPASLEERFVIRALEAPLLSVKRETCSLTESIEEPSQAASTTPAESLDSQSTASSAASSAVFSEVSVATSTTTVAGRTGSLELRQLLRIRTAISFIMSLYLTPTLATRLQGILSSPASPIDFSTLDSHLKHLAVLRTEALASRSITDFSRKRGNLEDDEAAEERAEKKRRLDEEERRTKANESRGVRDLKKVNVSGMKKMSDFFSKKAATTQTKS